MKQMPRIDKYMTAMPVSIGKELPLEKAIALMREHQIRHLPVQEAGRLIGVLSDRDIKLISSINHEGVLTVDDAMTPEPYAVTPQAALDAVLSEMAEHKYGCAIVEQENGKIVGIFTANDGLKVLSDILHEHYKVAV